MTTIIIQAGPSGKINANYVSVKYTLTNIIDTLRLYYTRTNRHFISFYLFYKQK